MTIETTVILKADEGKILRRKSDGLETPSVWLRIGESQDDWEEIDAPVPGGEAQEDIPVMAATAETAKKARRARRKAAAED